MKIRMFSVHSDFKTGFFFKFFLALGLFLLVFGIVEYFLRITGIQEGAILGLIALSPICFFACGISYFFSTQFAKLSKIAEEIECEE